MYPFVAKCAQANKIRAFKEICFRSQFLVVYFHRQPSAQFADSTLFQQHPQPQILPTF